MDTIVFELGALVFGLTEVFKKFLPKEHKKQLTPLLALLFGASLNIYLHGYSPEHLTLGLAIGLSAAGLYRMGEQVMSQKTNP